MKILKLQETDSTNSWVSVNDDRLSSPSLVYSINQTQGRGQRGNSWESEPGKNITASLFFHPKNFEASKQFYLSEAIALAITDFLQDLGISAKVKWPNDIYVKDKKICGILVEHVVTGKYITRSIAGFGININQKKFFSDAPNPTSVSLITGKEYDIEELIISLSKKLDKYLKALEGIQNLHEIFISNLWRNDGNFYEFYDKKVNEKIKAGIISIAEDGILTLKTETGEKREYAFKEIEFIL